MHVLQITWRWAKPRVKSVHNFRQAGLLTATRLQCRAPGIRRDNHGGRSTSDNATTSAASPSLFLTPAAPTVIVDLALLISSVNRLWHTTKNNEFRFYDEDLVWYNVKFIADEQTYGRHFHIKWTMELLLRHGSDMHIMPLGEVYGICP